MADKEYDDPYWRTTARKGYEGARRVGGAIARGPRTDIREIIRIPFAPVIGLSKWILWIIGIILAIVIVGSIFIFVVQSWRQGVTDIASSRVYALLSGIPGFEKIFPAIKQAGETVVDPSSAIVKTSNNDWKSTVEATETDDELGLSFTHLQSNRDLYFTTEIIEASASLAIKVPKVEGGDNEASRVTFGCLGETNGEVKEGMITPKEKVISKGELTFVDVKCKFPENTFTIESGVVQSNNQLQSLKIKFFVDYDFSSFTFWPVYTKSDEKIREDRLLGNDPFENVNDKISRYIRDREKGIVASEASKAPMRLILGGVGQPYGEKGAGEEGFNFLGVSFEKYGRYAPSGVQGGTVREIKDIKLRIPENFALNTGEGDFVESNDDVSKLNKKEYMIKKEELAKLNSRCERLGIKKEELPGYLSQKCFDALSDEDFTTSTSFRIEFLEAEDLSVTEFTARADYLYETYDTLLVNLRRQETVA